MVQSAKQAKILGVSIADKVLFTGTVHVPLHAKIVIVARGPGQHGDDLPDRAPEHEARHDADGEPG